MRTAGAIIGADILLMIDCNQSSSPNEAIRRIRMLEQFDLDWVEEPVIAEDLQGHARSGRPSRSTFRQVKIGGFRAVPNRY